MKRRMIVLILCILTIAGFYVVWAQQPSPPRMGRMQAGPGDSAGAPGGMCPMCAGMMGGIMQKSMVAAEDGGVFVLVGNQLMKFDGSLQLESRTELPVDMELIHRQMKTMMQNCPMCRMRMESQETPESPG